MFLDYTECRLVIKQLSNLFFFSFFCSATFPGMWERTITIGSAGKTFSVTGWKVR